ncbi:hypothetical protein [Aliarcobacter cryaerophilus]|uniref:hypothetical protein n=1 Tax=Aliarcobacter cryaerophilus TaxID=28198 RepID=UPI0021B3135A|nr:hypothetical protein [Aliarcobacter cryaerophilus]MCT7506135.1 hypothetical protein [Aliarcobacter cryaerophilus]
MLSMFDYKKIMSIRFFFLILSMLLFLDLYCIIFINDIKNFMDIKISSVKNYIDIQFIIAMIVYIFFMSTLTRLFAVWLIIPFEFFYRNKRKRYTHQISANVVLRKALRENNSVLYNYYKESKKYYDDLFDICALSLGVVTLLIVDFYYYESLARQGILLLINSEYILVSLLGIFLISVPFLIIGFFAEYIQGKSYVQINRQIQKKLFLRKYNNDKIKR